MSNKNLLNNFKHVKGNITIVQNSSKFKHEINLVAVSKTFDSEKIKILNTEAHQKDFAENYVQELEHKAIELSNCNITWHFIGNIQSNKIKKIAKYASWVHSLENATHAIRLNELRDTNSNILNILIEVNISNDNNKHGVQTFAEIAALAKTIETLPKLRFRGLMGVAKDSLDSNLINQQFAQLKIFFDKLIHNGYNIDTLSMGMSHDYKLAILNGATMLRIGSAIFGVRNYA